MNNPNTIENQVLSILRENMEARNDDMKLYLLVCNRCYQRYETDGKASPYKHGEVTIKHSSISVLSIDPEELPEENYGETNYELLSDEDFEVNKNLF